MKSHQTTIYDLAKALGLSKSTVSRALTNNPNISEHTKKKVLELAKKMEYERNLFSVGLIKKKTHCIGIIVPEFERSFFPNIINHVQQKASESGYSILVMQSNENYKTEVKHAKFMLSRQVDGLLIAMSKETTNFDHLNIYLKKEIPIVLFNRSSNKIIAPKVIVNDEEGAFNAVEHLIKRGYKRIAHITGPKTLNICQDRLNGYLKALTTYGIEADDNLITYCNLSLKSVQQHINHLLKQTPRPDAIFASNDYTAMEIIKALKKRNIKIPQEIAVVGFSNDYLASIIEPSLTSVEIYPKKIGDMALNLLIEQINQKPNQWKSPTITVQPKLIVRKSS